MLDDFTHQGSCVVRAPLLPFDVLRDGLAPERLRTLLADPVIREALFVASPSLDIAVDAWLADPAAPRAHEVELILARYITRMAARPTPFGLFSTCAVATIGARTSLIVADRAECRRSSRLDMQYLTLLAEALERDPTVGRALCYRPNSSLKIGPQELRYVEAHHDPRSRRREFRLVSVEPDNALTAALDAATHVQTKDAIRDAILRHDPSVPLVEAVAFVDELAHAQVIESSVQPPVTGGDSLGSYASALALPEATRDISARLADVHGALRAMDERGLGAPRSAYRAIMTALEPLPVALDPARLFQVDAFRSSGAPCIGEGIVQEVKKAIALLHRMEPARDNPAMRRFRERFTERYGDREVALAEALDEECGLGFDMPNTKTGDVSPLLADLKWPGPPASEDPFGPRDVYKMRRLLALCASGRFEWQLDEQDVRALEVPAPAALPDAMAATVTLVAHSSEAIDGARYELLVHHVGGPSGASMLARFCHGDPGILALVERHLRAEERCRPDAVFAEIVHLPEGRMGNILCRPILRSHEIAYLGSSGAPAERQIAIDDLRVQVHQGKVRLRSVKLGQEVIPRLSSAHNHQAASLAMYRFLCALQYEGTASGLRWSWGPLASAPFLPRVRRGRAILSLATWTIETKELERAAREGALRRDLGLPRWTSVVDHDRVLPLDLEQPHAVTQLLALARGSDTIRLQELYPDPERMCATGTDGRYTHEIVIPLARTQPSSPKHVLVPSPDTERTFPPGSAWLYAKIYTGPATSDRVLRTAIAPLVREGLEAKWIDGWFFIRYADPEPHVRVRFRGEPQRLLGDVWPRLHARLAPLLASGTVVRIQLDTYERETERYGGAQGILVAERIFEADSVAALALLEALGGDADARWRAALYGMHTLLEDTRIDDTSRRELSARGREAFATEHRLDAAARRSLGARYRTERAAVERLLAGAFDGDEAYEAYEKWEPVLAIFRARSLALVPQFARLRELCDAGALQTPLEDILQSFIHMHVNRVIRDNPRAHEMVLYDFLFRAYDSAAARSRRAAAPVAPRFHA
ncbi:lantibiotic dehydratase [Pendulispora rubella]|uniref:Lantibiotic dehydratase n=1 Tax=Pendulispora rubella TaxID=2741070 RepID=A0ABZ2L836_9BACT